MTSRRLRLLRRLQDGGFLDGKFRRCTDLRLKDVPTGPAVSHEASTVCKFSWRGVVSNAQIPTSKSNSNSDRLVGTKVRHARHIDGSGRKELVLQLYSPTKGPGHCATPCFCSLVQCFSQSLTRRAEANRIRESSPCQWADEYIL
jgi:hypothetical protein